MKTLTEKPSSILPEQGPTVGKGEVTTERGTPPGMGKIRATGDWSGGGK